MQKETLEYDFFFYFNKNSILKTYKIYLQKTIAKKFILNKRSEYIFIFTLK